MRLIFDFFVMQEQYRIQYPHLTDEQVVQATRAYIMQVTSALNRQPMGYDRSHYQAEMARARAQQQQMYPGMYSNGQQVWTLT